MPKQVIATSAYKNEFVIKKTNKKDFQEHCSIFNIDLADPALHPTHSAVVAVPVRSRSARKRLLGAICGSAISMDLPAQSMDPQFAQKSMDICAIYGLCVGCKSFHYSNPSLAQTYYIDRLATSTNLYNRRNRITDCRRRNSVEHSVASCIRCSCRKITIIRHVRFVPGWYFENSSPITYGNLTSNINS